MFRFDDWNDPVTNQWDYNGPGSPYVLDSTSSFPSTAENIFFAVDLTVFYELGTPTGIGLLQYTIGEYVKVKLADSPNAITTKAADDALALHWAARNLYEKELNRNTPYLTCLV